MVRAASDREGEENDDIHVSDGRWKQREDREKN